MSLFVPKFDEPVLGRDAEAEVVGSDPVAVRLLADSSASGGALSTVRVTLAEGADGARPHTHHHSAEMFYLLDGVAEVLSGDDVVTAERGDLIIVPPDRPHAFAAVPGAPADLLIVITPGVIFFGGLQDLTAAYEKETGTKITIKSSGMGRIVNDVKTQEPAPDVIMLPHELMSTLSLDGGIKKGSFTPLGRQLRGASAARALAPPDAAAG